jgi:alpha-tubulin suppressor-like RCC1 family protein
MRLRSLLAIAAVAVASGSSTASAGSTVATGHSFTCATTASGGAQCWGSNVNGQLGDGTYVSRGTPADVAGLSSGIAAVGAAPGGDHACALTGGGGVKCWGRNTYGQLGDGTTTERVTPVDTIGLASGIGAVAVGGRHTCALTGSGGLKCWGSNSDGQLGDGTTTSQSTAVDVAGLTSGVAALSAGYSHTCALTTGGGVACWGRNTNGQLGDGTTTSRSTPADVTGLTSGVLAVAAGSSHTCALIVGGGVKCWGANSNGQLGNGTTTGHSTPVDVTGLASGVSAVAAGSSHTCALILGGGVKCWGYNSSGQLGQGTTTQRTTPVDVTGLAHAVSAVSAGFDHTCVTSTDGGVQCWGSDADGQLGVGRSPQVRDPTDVVAIGGGASRLATGASHACVVTAAGSALCWGCNLVGRLGDGTTTSRSTPAAVSNLAGGVGGLAAGYTHTCAVTSGGGVKCWGYNYDGELGDGTTTQRLTPVDVTGLPNGVAAAAAANHHTCALTTDGGVKCWGANYLGQLGDGTTTQRMTPVDVTGLTTGVASIAAGFDHTCALTGDTVKCWGDNHSGQLGDGTTTDRSTPVDVVGLAGGVVALTAGGSGQTCALTAGGGVKCWGANHLGQLGDGTTTGRLTPVDVTGLASGVAAVAAGSYHTCALMEGAGVKCWGYNNAGQLGDGTRTQRTTPTDVSGLTSGMAAVTGGDYFTCGLTSGNGVKCWGANEYGQVGDGLALFRPWPINPLGFGATVMLTDLRQVYDGTPKSAAVATVPAGLAVAVTYTGIGGTTYGPSQSPPSGAGSYRAFATVADGGYSGSGSATDTLVVAKATPGLTWADPAAITFGTALSATQLNAAANVAGTFAYTPPAGTVLGAGAGQSLSVTFTPTDTVNYATATKTVTIDVNGAISFDVTGDLTSDILWRHTSGGDVWLWPMHGASRQSETHIRTVADTNWEIRGVADFTGDGKADILWRNRADGMVYLWPMSGSAPLAETYVATVDPAYDIAGTGDFDGSGRADILWRGSTAGDVWIWLMNGATPLSEVYVDTVDPGYLIKGIGDLDNDTKADIVWHGAAGDVWVWLMNGTTRLSQSFVGTVPDTHYQIQQVADFDGDRKADILWWNAIQGDVWIWPMNGASVVSESYVGTVPDTNYRIMGAGDYDGNARADILWRNIVQGDVWVWLMNGTTTLSENYVGTVQDPGYQIVR